jgi:hypothetical protein
LIINQKNHLNWRISKIKFLDRMWLVLVILQMFHRLYWCLWAIWNSSSFIFQKNGILFCILKMWIVWWKYFQHLATIIGKMNRNTKFTDKIPTIKAENFIPLQPLMSCVIIGEKWNRKTEILVEITFRFSIWKGQSSTCNLSTFSSSKNSQNWCRICKITLF